MSAKGFLDRLNNGEKLVVAEGYLFEFERRGYLKAGAFVPEVVVDHPHLLKAMYEEFVHAGSDVVEAFTYYGHRNKLKLISREDELESFNRQALRLARQVADDNGVLMAGNICNSTTFVPGNAKSAEETKLMFKEQIEWAVEEGADYMIAETFGEFEEAKIALEAILQYGKGLPAVITMAPNSNNHPHDRKDVTIAQALRELEVLGAHVVGINCYRGPDTILPIIKEIRQTCKGPIACLPVPYRTSEIDGLCMQNLKDQKTGEKSFPVNLDSWLCSRYHIELFTHQLVEIGVQYMGLCCGNRAGYIRTMSETLGRQPPASKFSPDMSQHFSQVNDDKSFTKQRWNKDFKH